MSSHAFIETLSWVSCEIVEELFNQRHAMVYMLITIAFKEDRVNYFGNAHWLPNFKKLQTSFLKAEL